MTGAWAVRLYPPSFRERYGAELDALVSDLGGGHPGDLLRGAARAWLRPSFAGPDALRRRRQATAATVWVAWCAGFLVAPAVNRALLDPPVPGAPRALLDAGQGLFVAGWVLALAGALPVVLGSLLPVLRRGAWRTVRPLLVTVALGLAAAGALAVLALVAHHQPGHPTGWGWAALAVAGVLGLAFVAALGLAPAMVLGRLAPPGRTLALPFVLAVPLAGVLAALAASSVVAVATTSGGFGGLGVVATPLALVVSCGASGCALVSAARGVLAGRGA